MMMSGFGNLLRYREPQRDGGLPQGKLSRWRARVQAKTAPVTPRKIGRAWLAMVAGLGLWGARASANVKISPLFSEGAVLQQGAPVRVWGEGEDGEVVTVQLGRQIAQTTVLNGRWTVRFAPLKASSRELTLTASGFNVVRIEHLLVGEVWICSGQSNMELALKATDNAEDVARESTDPQLRLFRVERALSSQPLNTVRGNWKSASPSTTPDFSAVAYYFGRQLRRELKVPIGLVVSAWSNTRAEAWTSLPALQLLNTRIGGFDDKLRNVMDEAAQQALYDKKVAAWKAAGSFVGDPTDEGVSAEAAGWSAPDADTTEWTPLAAPGAWETIEGEESDGARWLRRDIDLPQEWAGQDLTLSLGAVDDFDQTFWNGEPVGHMGAETNNYWITPRRYTIPGRLVKAGHNVIIVRVFDRGGNGGLMGPESSMFVQRAGQDGPVTISLVGTWLSRWERRIVPKPVFVRSYDSNAPSAIYNGMIAPLTTLPIRGFTWYQGEANAPQAWRYGYLLPALITDWRRAWSVLGGAPLGGETSGATTSQNELPFYIVQLAPFLKTTSENSVDTWAELREAQRQTVARVPDTALTVITDAGDEANLHPRRKEPVGTRLALSALALTYGRDLEWSGPQLQSFEIREAEVKLKFAHAKGLQTSDGGPVQGFMVAGEDHLFYPAQARVEGETVRVWAPQVGVPLAVRYGWTNFPVLNLVNGSGLPASPFRTDDFPLVTQPQNALPPTMPQFATQGASTPTATLASATGLPATSNPATPPASPIGGASGATTVAPRPTAGPPAPISSAPSGNPAPGGGATSNTGTSGPKSTGGSAQKGASSNSPKSSSSGTPKSANPSAK